jgi:hypothetical protein
MDDYSHIGYHRGDWFKWFGLAFLVLFVAACLIALFSRMGMRDAAGNTTIPPDWPQLGYVVDSAAVDLHFDPDIRSLLGAGEVVAQRTSKTGSLRDNTPIVWQIMFNHPDPPEQLLAATDQQLQAAGWTSYGGRSMEHFAQTGLLDHNWVDPSGKYTLQMRYWSKPPKSYGRAQAPQHWHVMIMEKKY